MDSSYHTILWYELATTCQGVIHSLAQVQHVCIPGEGGHPPTNGEVRPSVATAERWYWYTFWTTAVGNRISRDSRPGCAGVRGPGGSMSSVVSVRRGLQSMLEPPAPVARFRPTPPQIVLTDWERDLLEVLNCEPKPRVIHWLHGPPNCGKTTFTSWLAYPSNYDGGCSGVPKL